MSEYYEKIIKENVDYEETYWGKVIDPDGKVRNLLDEREKFLANVMDELDFINSLPPSKIIDIGCGPGFMLSGIEDKHQKFGLEISKYAAQHAKKYATIYEKPIEELNLDENSFDVVISHHVIEHVDSPESFLTQIKKTLKPGGILILSTPDFNCVCAKLFKERYRLLHDKTHVNLFSFKSLKNMLQDFGFEVKDVDFPYFNTEYFNENNILKMLKFETAQISPACWGNFMTFYCKKEINRFFDVSLSNIKRKTNPSIPPKSLI